MNEIGAMHFVSKCTKYFLKKKVYKILSKKKV